MKTRLLTTLLLSAGLILGSIAYAQTSTHPTPPSDSALPVNSSPVEPPPSDPIVEPEPLPEQLYGV